MKCDKCKQDTYGLKKVDADWLCESCQPKKKEIDPKFRNYYPLTRV